MNIIKITEDRHQPANAIIYLSHLPDKLDTVQIYFERTIFGIKYLSVIGWQSDRYLWSVKLEPVGQGQYRFAIDERWLEQFESRGHTLGLFVGDQEFTALMFWYNARAREEQHWTALSQHTLEPNWDEFALFEPQKDAKPLEAQPASSRSSIIKPVALESVSDHGNAAVNLNIVDRNQVSEAAVNDEAPPISLTHVQPNMMAINDHESSRRFPWMWIICCVLIVFLVLWLYVFEGSPIDNTYPTPTASDIMVDDPNLGVPLAEPPALISKGDTFIVEKDKIMYADVLLNDKGDGLTLIDVTKSQYNERSISIDPKDGRQKIKYLWDNRRRGQETLTYTVEDAYGKVSTATVTFERP